MKPLGLGCAPIGNMFDVVDDDEAIAVVHAAYDAGIRFFDTAPLYGHGLSERRLGAALATLSGTTTDALVRLWILRQTMREHAVGTVIAKEAA